MEQHRLGFATPAEVTIGEAAFQPVLSGQARRMVGSGNCLTEVGLL
ncbi:MAG: hypothetical protein RMJ46_05535 [Bacteroidota bacterium]|nr:hypothetical protein [Bacteroidota bacterium]